jgi:hypothetical protein
VRLFDYVVGGGEQRLGNAWAERPSGFEIDYQFDKARLKPNGKRMGQ